MDILMTHEEEKKDFGELYVSVNNLAHLGIYLHLILLFIKRHCQELNV